MFKREYCDIGRKKVQSGKMPNKSRKRKGLNNKATKQQRDLDWMGIGGEI
jgi:hypothetical protein